jgi:hypothetical protein
MKLDKRTDRLKVEKRIYNEAIRQPEQKIKDRIIELIDYRDEFEIELRALQDALYSVRHPIKKRKQ